MDIAMLEDEVLKLSAIDRARLVRELLDSLDDLPPQELERLWFVEASRRAAQLDTGEVCLVSGEEVDRKARRVLSGDQICAHR